MKHLKMLRIGQFTALLVATLFMINCSSDSDSGGSGQANTPLIAVTGSIAGFNATDVLSHSNSQSIQVKGTHLTNNLSVNASANFEVSLDDLAFSNQVSINKDDANASNTTVFVRFSPSQNALGNISGTLSLQSSQATTVTMALNGEGLSIAPIIHVDETSLSFDDTEIMSVSQWLSVIVNGDHLTSEVTVNAPAGFKVSLDNMNFSDAIQIASAVANNDTTVYVRFEPTAVGTVSEVLTLSSTGADNVEVSLSGLGLPIVHNYVTFNSERLAFGGGYSQSSTQTFNLHNDLSNIETIKMYVKLRCPAGGCDEWDVYANVKVTDPSSGEMYELGRYITPYWNDNSQLERGFEFDVTDFKSLLNGMAELRIRTECWNDRGYEVTVDFDYIEGTPDYPYYAISRVIAYDDWSSSGVPYGVSHSFDLDKTITIPANAESTHLRTIITGWGHATPNDNGGRPCAEWCYRTHNVLINGTNEFDHEMGPLGCASNPVSNQSPGNWQPDRAGWCPGMAVPTRIDEFTTSMSGNTFNFEYDYQDWTSDGANGNAYYATSTFVVVKSNTPIVKPTVAE